MTTRKRRKLQHCHGFAGAPRLVAAFAGRTSRTAAPLRQDAKAGDTLILTQRDMDFLMFSMSLPDPPNARQQKRAAA